MGTGIRTLMRGIVDYAGLFPPAGLEMLPAVANYAGYRSGPDAWALGRFVVPAARLPEFSAAAAAYVAGADAPWRLAALGGPDPKADADAIAAFNARAAGAVVDVLERKAQAPDEIAQAMAVLPQGVVPYFELPVAEPPQPLVAALARHGGRAKVRTGGVQAFAFPTTAELARFIRACVSAGVPLKATAGLHHPVRGEYRLTYAPDSDSATMFGFLNVFLAAAFARNGMDATDVERLLDERDPAAFRADEAGIAWRGHVLSLPQLEAARAETAIAFGSCSFTEPLGDLAALGLL